MRRLLATTAVLSTVAGLLPALASTASAEDPSGLQERVYAVLAGDVYRPQIEDNGAVQVVDLAGGPRVTHLGPFSPVFPTSSVQPLLVSFSAAQDRTVTVERTGFEPGDYRIRVRGATGGFLRDVPFRPADGPDLFDAVLSPDGARIVWRQGTSSNRCDCYGSARLFSSLVAGGPVTEVPASEREDVSFMTPERPAFLADDLLLYGSDVLPLTGPGAGELQGVVTSGGEHFTADRSGTRIAFSRAVVSSIDASVLRTLEIVTVVRTGTTVSAVGTPAVVPLGRTARFDVSGRSTFSLDGTQLHYLLDDADPYTTSADVWTVPVAGGVGRPLGVRTAQGEISLSVGSVAPSSAPAAPTSVGPALLDGPRATIPYALPAGSSATSVAFVRSSPGLPTVTRTATVPAPLVETGLEIGRTYSYTISAVGPDGSVGPATPTSLSATLPPVIRAADTTSSVSTTTSFPVRFATPGNPGSTRYDLDKRIVGQEPEAWAYRDAGPSRVHGPSVQGATYGFSGVAQDAFGNRTVRASSARVVVPRDSTQLVLRAGRHTTVRRTGSYGGSLTALLSAGARASTRVIGDRFQVIGERGPSTGVLEVLLDGRRLARVSTRAPSRQMRQVLWSASTSTVRSGLLTVRSGGGVVLVDAIGQRARP